MRVLGEVVGLAGLGVGVEEEVYSAGFLGQLVPSFRHYHTA